MDKITEILEFVSKKCNISIMQMQGNSIEKDVCNARYVFYFVAQNYGFTQSQFAHKLNKSRSAVSAVMTRIKTNKHRFNKIKKQADIILNEMKFEKNFIKHQTKKLNEIIRIKDIEIAKLKREITRSKKYEDFYNEFKKAIISFEYKDPTKQNAYKILRKYSKELFPSQPFSDFGYVRNENKLDYQENRLEKGDRRKFFYELYKNY